MDGLANRLKWAREHLAGVRSARQFALDNEIPPSTYAGYENGSRNISLDLANKLAKLLSVDAGWLITGHGKPRRTSTLSPLQKELTWVPVFSWIHAGQVNAADMDADPEDLVPAPIASSTLRALRVRGSSMNRKAEDGDVIVVDYDQCQPYDQALVVARIGDEVTFKQYRDTSGPARLEPLSTEPHDTIFPAEGFEILGRVVWILKKP